MREFQISKENTESENNLKSIFIQDDIMSRALLIKEKNSWEDQYKFEETKPYKFDNINMENIIFNKVNDDPPQELVKALEGDHLIGGLLDDIYNDDCIIMDPVFLTAPGIYSFSANGDRVNGSSSHDFIMTLGCSDRVWGNGGNDVIIGGHGSDILYGGAGNDTIYTGHADYLDSSWDPLEGHIDVELELHDSFSFDRVYAGDGDDFVMGDFGVDVIHGGDGDDILHGGWLKFDENFGVVGTGKDYIYGGDGNDQIHVTSGAGIVDGGDGDDLIYDTLFLGINSFQALYFATNGDNTVYKGGNGNDTMHVVSGTAYGGSGDDRLFVNGSTAYGGDGDDYLFNDFNGIHVGGYLNGGKGNDILKVNNFSASEKATFSFSEDHDTYIGFQQGTNKIDLTYIGAQFSDLSFNGNIIEFNGHTATVEDFSGTFIEEDFLF